jgi:2-iminobutanoate/2-iminopropanoate deaminase
MPEKQVVATEGAPQSDAPYSQGIVTGDLLFVSGQGPRDPDSMELVTDSIAAQTERTLENVRAIVAESGATLADIVKTTVYLGDMDDYDAMNAVYERYFSEDPPARVCIEAGRLPNDISVEIEAIARVD